MPRIPVYDSRAAAPGPISGLGTELAAPGRALTRLGGAVAGFGDDLARHAARKRAVEGMRRAASDGEHGEPRDEAVPVPGADLPGGQDDAAREAADDVRAVLDHANDDARLAVTRADALQQASLDSDPEQRPARALAYFDAAIESLLAQSDDPALRQRRQALAQAHREVLVQRLAQRRSGALAAPLNGKLAAALDTYAEAVHRDRAMLAALLKKGADTITESARLAGLGPGHIEAMTKAWVRQAHLALVEGTIARDPGLALASLESGELDEALGNDAALTARLIRQARNAVAVAAAAERQRARTQRQRFDLHMTEHLERIRKTGRGDPAAEASAEAVLDPDALAAFRDEVAAAEAHHAARRTYAFMTAEEIAADIGGTAAGAGPQGGGPRDPDNRQSDRRTRRAARDEVLAERAADPAGWAMRDETVAEAFAAAEDALASAAPGTPEMARAEADFRRALALRERVQRAMGETPRLLTEAARDALAAELEGLSPPERLARIGALRRRYGDAFDALARELAGRIAPDTAGLLEHADDPVLTRALARGMATEGVRDSGARELPLPLARGALDKSRLEDKQLYRLVTDGRIQRVVYDRKADALVPAPGESGAVGAEPGRAAASEGAEGADTGATELEPRDLALPTGPEDDKPKGGKPQADEAGSDDKEEDGSGIAHVPPSPGEAQRNKTEAVGNWLKLAEIRSFKIPSTWKELPRTPDGSIDRGMLEDRQVYHVLGTDGTRSAWEWNEKNRAFMPFRRRTPAFSLDGMHELIGAQVRQTADGRPIYNMEQDRINAINWGVDAVFEVADNPAADDTDPLQAPLVAGYARATVARHSATIDRLADERDVDPDLVKAIMYREQAAGPLQPAADLIRVGDTVSPMGVNPQLWGELVDEGADPYDSETNIAAAMTLIRHIEDRLEDPAPEKIATLYNSLAKEAVSNYGARVGRYYREKPWIREDSAASLPQDINFAP